MSDPIRAARAPAATPPLDDLEDGSVFVELQIPSWPPAVTHTLLRNSDARSALTIRAKPSGRLRVQLERAGHPPLVVRTVHLRLQAPGLIRLNVAWRGDAAIVAAGGQIIGSSSEAIPDGVACPGTVAETGAPLDHADNESARLKRGRRVRAYLQNHDIDSLQLGRWLGALDDTALSLKDLVELVRQRRHHHLPIMVDMLARLVCGDRALLQWCAGLLDTPLTIYAPPVLPYVNQPAAQLAAAFDVVAARDGEHSLAVDIDVWLHHEHPWSTGQRIPAEALLLAIDGALTPPLDSAESEDNRAIRVCFSQPAVIAALCGFASGVCTLAESVVSAAAESARALAPRPESRTLQPVLPGED